MWNILDVLQQEEIDSVIIFNHVTHDPDPKYEHPDMLLIGNTFQSKE